MASLLPFFSLLFLSLLFTGLVYLFYRRNRLFLSDLFLLFLFVSLGALWQVSFPKLERWLNKESLYTLKVVSFPQGHKNRHTFFVYLERVNGLALGYRVKAMDYSRSLEYLAKYRLKARLSRIKYQGRFYYLLRIKSSTFKENLPLNPLEKLQKESIAYLNSVLKRYVDAQAWRFLMAVFLGRRELLGEEKGLFVEAGLAHLLAISGLHLGLVSLILLFGLKLLGIKFRVRLFITLVFLFFYSSLVGVNPSTVRALLMYTVFAFSFFFKRKLNPFNSFGLAGLLSLLLNPTFLLEISFQLSYLCVFFLLLGFSLFPYKAWSGFVFGYLRGIFLSSLFISIGILPVISYYFGRVYLLGALSNLIFIPFFTLILIINFLLLGLSFFTPLASLLGELLSFFIFLFNRSLQILASLKFSYLAYTFPLPLIFLYYLFLTLVIFYLKNFFRPGIDSP